MVQAEQGGPPIGEIAQFAMEQLVLSGEAQSLRRSLADEAIKLLGAPSILYNGPQNGITPQGFDCSGFAKFVLEKAGVDLSSQTRHVNEFFDTFGVLVHWPFHKRGDLVFFSRDAGRPTHMGIILDSHHFIHAPGATGSEVEVAFLRQEPAQRSLIEPIYSTNPIGFKRLALPMSGGRWKAY